MGTFPNLFWSLESVLDNVGQGTVALCLMGVWELLQEGPLDERKGTKDRACPLP